MGRLCRYFTSYCVYRILISNLCASRLYILSFLFTDDQLVPRLLSATGGIAILLHYVSGYPLERLMMLRQIGQPDIFWYVTMVEC